MQEYKKFTVFLIPLVTALTLMMVSIFSTSALEGYPNDSSYNTTFNISSVWDKDPNGDGVLDIYDSIHIKRYLNGLVDADNLSEYDINNNSLITAFDAWVVDAHLLGILPNNEIAEPNIAADYTSDVNYVKHNCASLDSKSYSTYTLSRPLYSSNTSNMNCNNSVSQGNATLQPSDSINAVLKPSDLSPDKNNAVVGLLDPSPDSNFIFGSGFIIGNHTIATAAHCVFQQMSNDFVDFKIRIYDEDGQSELKTVRPTAIHIPKTFFDYDGAYTKEVIESDYALIYVKEDLSEYNKFNLGITLDHYVDMGWSVMVSGFPTLSFADNKIRVISRGRIYPNSTTEKRFEFSAKTASGFSGGPIFFNETYHYTENGKIKTVNINTALGIYDAMVDVFLDDPTQEKSSGVRFNEDSLYFYYSNPYL